MKSLNIGQGVLPNFNSPRPLSSSNDRRVYSVLLAASLGYISVGYHLSSFNLISIFLWEKTPHEYQLSTFQNISNIAFTLGTFIVALFISFNKIKFTDYRKILILSDIMMIFGSLCSFGVFLLDSSYIFFGRFVCAEAAAINVTCILAFTREAQFYLSQSEFKAETRRFFGEGLFAVGVLVGFISSLFIPDTPIYPRVGDPNDVIKGCLLISIIPVAVSIVRIIFLNFLGDLRSSGYAQAFTDEGLVEAEEDEGEGETLYYLKFKETKSVAKLFKEPYRRRLLICILLYILQATVGYFLLISEAYNFSTLLSSGRYENIRKTLIIFGAIFFGVLVLLSLNFLRKKVSRKIFMFLGAFCGAAGAAACLYSVNNNSFDLSNVTFAYYFVICFGFGFPVELYIEEILPAKGIQFLQAIKWLLIALMNIFLIFTKNSDLTMDKINVPLGIFFVANIITLIVICTVVPETANLSQAQINALFNGTEQNDKGTDNNAPKVERGTSKDLDYSED